MDAKFRPTRLQCDKNVQPSSTPPTTRQQSILDTISSQNSKETATGATFIMAGAANKRQKREDYKKSQNERPSTEAPKKKFYRQRAHANPFSDHQLT